MWLTMVSLPTRQRVRTILGFAPGSARAIPAQAAKEVRLLSAARRDQQTVTAIPRRPGWSRDGPPQMPLRIPGKFDARPVPHRQGDHTINPFAVGDAAVPPVSFVPV